MSVCSTCSLFTNGMLIPPWLGKQASLVADFSVTQFCSLTKYSVPTSACFLIFVIQEKLSPILQDVLPHSPPGESRFPIKYLATCFCKIWVRWGLPQFCLLAPSAVWHGPNWTLVFPRFYMGFPKFINFYFTRISKYTYILDVTNRRGEYVICCSLNLKVKLIPLSRMTY